MWWCTLWLKQKQKIRSRPNDRANQESCQKGFSLPQQEVGQQHPRWGLLSLADIQADSAGRATWHQRRSWHSGSVAAGTRSMLASPVAKKTPKRLTQTLPHSCWGANGAWQGGQLFKSGCCLEMAFMWMGTLTSVEWRLSLHAGHPAILFSWDFFNKQCLKDTEKAASLWWPWFCLFCTPTPAELTT